MQDDWQPRKYPKLGSGFEWQFRWEGHKLFVDNLDLEDDMCKICPELAHKLTGHCYPESCKVLQGGRKRALNAAHTFWLMRMPAGSLLLSVTKPHGQKPFAKQIDSVFNGEEEVWQSWATFAKLSYLMEMDVEAYCYVAFQPFTEHACLMVHGSWLKAHGSWLMAKGGRLGPGSQGSARPGPGAPLGSRACPASLGQATLSHET